MPTMIDSLYLLPPFAIARVGSGREPMDAYAWGPNDDGPRGTGKTTVVPIESLRMDASGGVSAYRPKELHFKEVTHETDGRAVECIRPVCPWYELHGKWRVDGNAHEGAITETVLEAAGFTLRDLRWTVRVANHKAFNMTTAEGDKFAASVEIEGSNVSPHVLEGVSDDQHPSAPLVLRDRPIVLGSVRLSRPTAEFPELRLRFHPPAGVVYGPTDLQSRLPQSTQLVGAVRNEWRTLELLNNPERLILNPESEWCGHVIADGEPLRTVPRGQYAHARSGAASVSFGLIDDFSDGYVECRLRGAGDGGPRARARIVVGPPDLAPDRRHFLSVADGFKDRADRETVTEEYDGLPIGELSADLQDLLMRVHETMGLMNLDAINRQRHFEAAPPYFPAQPTPLAMEGLLAEDLPLTARARRHHRRAIALEVLEDILREQQGRAEEAATDPGHAGPPAFAELFNSPPVYETGARPVANAYSKMPALMRGSDACAAHLTRRQYAVLELWVRRLRETVDP